MYKLITSSKDSDGLNIGFDCSREKKSRTGSKQKRKWQISCKNYAQRHLRLCRMSRKSLGYKLTLKRTKDDGVIDKAGGIADAEIKIDHIQWYNPFYTFHSSTKYFVISNFKKDTNRTQAY